MMPFLVGCAIGAAVAFGIGAPLLLPWRSRVRYLTIVPMTDPLFGMGAPSRLDMREVRLVSVEAVDGHVELLADEIACPSGRRTTLTRDGCVPSVVAQLDAWAALATPLLMIVDHDGRAHVYGPNGVVTGLRLAPLSHRASRGA